MKLIALAMLSLLAVTLSAQAEEWPRQPLRILAGASPGGGTDAMARAVADKLGPALKGSAIVENKPGASNTLAAAAAAKSTDGHTLVMGVSTAHAIVPHLLKLSYDNDADLVPVVFVGSVPNVLVVNKDLKIATVQDLIAMAKARPGQLNFASSGAGSTQHIATELFEEATGTVMTHIPYRGSGPALLDLMAGQVQLSFDTLASAAGHIKGGTIRALAMTSARRNKEFPEVPTLAEVGVPGVEMDTWYGLYMPTGTPKEIQDRVHDEVARILIEPDTIARLASFGAETRAMSQAEFLAFHQAENRKYAAIIEKRAIKVD